MQKLSTKVIQAVYLILFSELLSFSSFSQVVIRDTVTITPKNISLKPLSVVATSPVVDVSFATIVHDLEGGSLIQIQMPDTIWTMYAGPCTGKASEMVLFGRYGHFFGGRELYWKASFQRLRWNEWSEFHLLTYISPDYGSSTEVSINLLGVGPNTRYVGYFTYEKPPLPTIQLQHGNFYISQEVHPIIQLTPEYSPLPGEKYASVFTCSPSQVINTADYVPQVLAQGYAPFFFTATATNPSGFATDTTTMMLLGLHHFAITPNPQSVEHGQTVNFSVQAEDIYNNVIDNFYNPVYSTDYPYDIPLTISWSPDTLGEVILAQGGASVAARSMDHLGKGARVQKSQPSQKLSATGQRKYPIKILNNEVSKNACRELPKEQHKKNAGYITNGDKLFKLYLLGMLSSLEFVADGKYRIFPIQLRLP